MVFLVLSCIFDVGCDFLKENWQSTWSKDRQLFWNKMFWRLNEYCGLWKIKTLSALVFWPKWGVSPFIVISISSSHVFVTDFQNTSPWMLQIVAYNLKHSNNNNNNNNSNNSASKYPWFSRSLEANAHVPHHIATLINHGVSMKLHFAITHWIALLRTSYVLVCKILDSQGILI